MSRVAGAKQVLRYPCPQCGAKMYRALPAYGTWDCCINEDCGHAQKRPPDPVLDWLHDIENETWTAEHQGWRLEVVRDWTMEWSVKGEGMARSGKEQTLDVAKAAAEAAFQVLWRCEPTLPMPTEEEALAEEPEA